MNKITVTNKSQHLTVTSSAKSRIMINTRGFQNLVQYLVQLKDVDATDLDNNETLVYDEASGKFVVEEMPIINGGEF